MAEPSLIPALLSQALATARSASDVAAIGRRVAGFIESVRAPSIDRRSGSHPLALDIGDLQIPVGQRSTTPPSAAEAPYRQAGDARAPIDAALSRVQASFAESLQATGLSEQAVSTILVLVNVTADAKVAMRDVQAKSLELATAESVAQVNDALALPANPLEPLTAAEIGQRLHLSDTTVRSRERAGQLFSILRTGRKRGQKFPSFQAWPEVAGSPLERTLQALVPAGQSGPVSGTEAYGFFTSPTDMLADLSPVEVLVGRPLSGRALEPAAVRLLSEPAPARLALVVETARTTAATDAR